MLNSVPRARLTHDDRRRQLLGIGLARLVDTPIGQLSIDDVAAEAGISRGLLFHYFPTKRDFHRECIAAAGRRMLRNTAPDPTLEPDARVRMMVRLFVEQIERRRAFYLSLLHGTGLADEAIVAVYDDLWNQATRRVLDAVGLDEGQAPVVHAWWAYVEDLALSWSAEPANRRARSVDELVEHSAAALTALLDLPGR